MRGVRRSVVLGFVGLVALAGCVVATNFDQFTSGVVGPDAGDATTGDALAPTCPADVATGSDPANCGRCGHDCLGGACSAGVCQPVVLAQNLPQLANIHLDGADLFYASQGDAGLGRVPKDGGATTTLAAQLTSFVVDVRGDDVFFGGDGTPFRRIARTGTGGVSVLSSAIPGNIVSTPSAVFYSNYANGNIGAGALYRRTIDGNVVTVANGLSGCEALDIQGGQLFYAENGIDGAPAPNLYRVSLDGGTPVTVAQIPARRIATDATSVYFTSYASAAVKQIPLDGGAVGIVSLAPVPLNGGDLSLDDTFVYWTVARPSDAGGAVYRAPKTGGDPQPLATGRGTPVGIAVDDVAIYWSEHDSGQIVKLAK